MATIGNPVKYQSNPYLESVGTGSTTAFTLGWTPGTSASLIVSVGGVTQPPSSYTVNGNTLTFSEAPPNGTTIVANGLGVKAMTTLAEANVVAKDSPTGSAAMPAGSTAQRSPNPQVGYERFNTDLGRKETWDGTKWSPSGGASGSGSDSVFFETDTLITQSYTIGQNAMVSGVTISIGTPAVITMANDFVAGQMVRFTTTGVLPTGLDTVNAFYVSGTGLSSTSFQVSTTLGGASVNTSGTQSGVHSCGKIKNAISGGNVTIANGANVTIPNGATWTIV